MNAHPPAPDEGRPRAQAQLARARAALAGVAAADATLWDGIDLDDPDDRRFGDYELLERLGRGGMGVVFRARQLGLDRQVALKFIVGGLAREREAVSRFLAEARAAARLHHPHIVPVFEVGTLEGMHFFTMPLLRGPTLAQAIAQRRPSPREAVALMQPIAAAVAYAHSLGLLHLDLKPANVLIDEHGQPQVCDFGLARHVDAGGGVIDSGAWGTPSYMAPEQRARGRLDARTDVHGLGAILHELLTGAAPRDQAGTTRVSVDAAGLPTLRSPRTLDPRIDRDLDAICMKCLATDPAARYPDVAALLADLGRCRDGHDVSARTPAWHERARRGLRRHPGAVLATLALAAALVAGLTTTAWQWRRAEHARIVAAGQAERTRQLAGLMAAAFPNANEEDARASAVAAVAWLKQHVPGDPVAQRAVLTAFRDALVAAHKTDAVAPLLDQIAAQLGADYHAQEVVRLAARGDRDSLLAAALIGIPRTPAGVSSPAHAAVLQRLYDHGRGDETALYAAALACHAQPQPCTHPEYDAALTRRFPDNAVNWLLVPAGIQPDDAALADRVRHAAAARGFDEHLGAFMGLMRQMLRDQRVPASILQPMQAVVPAAQVSASLRRDAADSVPLPFYADVIRICKPGSPALHQQPDLHDACGTFALHAMRAPQASILSKMVAVAIVRRLYKGTPLDAEAKAYRRQYVWMAQYLWKDGAPRDPEALQRDISRYGEWEAWRRQTARWAPSVDPPPGWVPANPNLLLLSEERKPPPAHR